MYTKAEALSGERWELFANVEATASSGLIVFRTYHEYYLEE